MQLRFRQPLAVATEDAWRWLVEPERLGRWLAEDAEARPEADGFLELRLRREEREITERGSTLAIEPPRRWVLAFERLGANWRAATRLSLTLSPRPGGCELDFFHEGFEHLALSTCLTEWERYRKRWREAGALLVAAVSPR